MKMLSHRYCRTAIGLTLLAIAGASHAQETGCALDAVKTLKLGNMFGTMSLQVARHTETFRMLQGKLGAQKADEVVTAEVGNSVRQYQEQWDSNLAQAWAALLSCEELQSLAQQKQHSPYARKFGALQGKAGEAMQAKSEPLLKAAVSDALGRAMLQP